MFNGAQRDILMAMSELPATAATPEGFLLSRDREGNALTSSPKDETRLQYIISAVDGLMDRCEDTTSAGPGGLGPIAPGRDGAADHTGSHHVIQTRRTIRARTTKSVPSVESLLDNKWPADRLKSSYEEDINECDGSTTEESNIGDVQSEDTEGIQDLACASPDGRRSSHLVESTLASDHHIRTALKDLILRLLYFLVTEEFKDGQSKLTLLVYFSGVLSLISDGISFQRPQNYTRNLSALIYYSCLIIVKVLLPRTSHNYVGYPARPRHRQLKKLNAVRQEKMCLASLVMLYSMYNRVVRTYVQEEK
ncbi:hypothetical protein LZ32DRAFT_623827, partial [Colletotrichum eremochloae]